MKWTFTLLLLVATPALSANDTQCLQWALWKEVRGESLKTMRAVMDVIDNRKLRSGKSYCSVLLEKSQFPWAKKGFGKVDFIFTTKYNEVRRMRNVLDLNYLYFNHRKHPWGVDTVKIGGLYFSK